ncbi:MAG: hypothetical protein ACNA78_06625 [Balneolaceae bacterium]
MHKNPFSSLASTLLVIAALVIGGCSATPAPSHWSSMVPDEVPYILVPGQGQTMNGLLEAEYMNILDDATPSALQLVNSVEELREFSGALEAMVFYPDLSNQWQPVWILQSGSVSVTELAAPYQQPFEQNRYRFEGRTIHKLFTGSRTLFATTIGDWLLISESSLGIESHLLTALGRRSAIREPQEGFIPGSLIVNISSLDRWVQQIARVTFRPSLIDAFSGGQPAVLRLRHGNESGDDWQWQYSGTFTFSDSLSVALRGATQAPAEPVLDRYIPFTSAAFSILRIPPRTVAPEQWQIKTDLDRHLADNARQFQDIAEALAPEIAFAAFAASGAESISEYIYVRHLQAPGRLRNALNELAANQLVIQDGTTYLVQSSWLGKLLGSELNPMDSFYISIFRDAAILAQRKGLAESVVSDSQNRRTMFYNDDYMMVRSAQPDDLSSLLYAQARPFVGYLQPWLFPQHHLDALVSNLDLLVLTTRATGGNRGELTLTSYQRDLEEVPYLERWLYPLAGATLTGQPATSDINNSGRQEIIFSTENGSIIGLATDGTVVFQTSTTTDRPIGPPVVYDWYGNNQSIILQAAGNKVYAWNAAGTILPNFPMLLGEEITTPLRVMDVTRNGVAEVVVGTANRQLHILDARGRAISGWPQTTNSVLRSTPDITEFDGMRTVFAVAENTLHGWQLNGTRRDGFPVFLDTPIYGNPLVTDRHLLGAGLDGNVYAIGTTPFFPDTLASFVRNDSLQIQTLPITPAGLNAAPSEHRLMVRNEDGDLVRENLILLQGSNGALFLYNRQGELRFTATMGQPASGTVAPTVLDIDRNNRQNVISLADFGRIYAWDLISGNRLFDLPTTGMQYPLIFDFTGDGNHEIVARTRDGIRAWTIFRTRMETESVRE